MVRRYCAVTVTVRDDVFFYVPLTLLLTPIRNRFAGTGNRWRTVMPYGTHDIEWDAHKKCTNLLLFYWFRMRAAVTFIISIFIASIERRTLYRQLSHDANSKNKIDWHRANEQSARTHSHIQFPIANSIQQAQRHMFVFNFHISQKKMCWMWWANVERKLSLPMWWLLRWLPHHSTQQIF